MLAVFCLLHASCIAVVQLNFCEHAVQACSQGRQIHPTQQRAGSAYTRPSSACSRAAKSAAVRCSSAGKCHNSSSTRPASCSNLHGQQCGGVVRWSEGFQRNKAPGKQIRSLSHAHEDADGGRRSNCAAGRLTHSVAAATAVDADDAAAPRVAGGAGLCVADPKGATDDAAPLTGVGRLAATACQRRAIDASASGLPAGASCCPTAAGDAR